MTGIGGKCDDNTEELGPGAETGHEAGAMSDQGSTSQMGSDVPLIPPDNIKIEPEEPDYSGDTISDNDTQSPSIAPEPSVLGSFIKTEVEETENSQNSNTDVDMIDASMSHQQILELAGFTSSDADNSISSQPTEESIRSIYSIEHRPAYPVMLLTSELGGPPEERLDTSWKDPGPKEEQNEVENEPMEDTEYTLFRCIVCFKECESFEVLKTHLLEHQEEFLKKVNENVPKSKRYRAKRLNSSASNDEKSFTCPVCLKKFLDWNAQIYHSKTECNLQFRDWNYEMKQPMTNFFDDSILVQTRENSSVLAGMDGNPPERSHAGPMHYIQCYDQRNNPDQTEPLSAGPRYLLYKCVVCEVEIKDEATLNTHVIEHQERQVRIAQKKHEEEQRKMRAEALRTITGEWICPVCRVQFKERTALDYHTKTVCKFKCNNSDFICLKCSLKFNTVKLLLAHLANHRKEESSKPFTNNVPYRRGKSTPCGVSTFECEDCTTVFNSWNYYRYHCETMGHMKLKDWDSGLGKYMDIYDGMFEEWRLQSEQVHKPTARGSFSEGERTKNDETSHKTTPVSRGRGNHIVLKSILRKVASFPSTSHENTDESIQYSEDRPSEAWLLTCTVCGEMNLSDSMFTSHMMSHQSAQKHSCSSCIFGFQDAKILERHIMEKIEKILVCNGKRGKEACEFCGLKCHCCICFPKYFRAVSKVKLYMCCVCRTMCSSENHLTLHMRKHKQEEYCCSKCGKFFGTKQGLQKHHTTGSCKTRFYCALCEKSFYTEINYNMHIDSGHGDCLETGADGALSLEHDVMDTSTENLQIDSKAHTFTLIRKKNNSDPSLSKDLGYTLNVSQAVSMAQSDNFQGVPNHSGAKPSQAPDHFLLGNTLVSLNPNVTTCSQLIKVKMEEAEPSRANDNTEQTMLEQTGMLAYYSESGHGADISS